MCEFGIHNMVCQIQQTAGVSLEQVQRVYPQSEIGQQVRRTYPEDRHHQ